MTLAESVKTCLFHKYAVFRGRAARSEYWWFTLATWVVADLPLQFVTSLPDHALIRITTELPFAVAVSMILIPTLLTLILLLPNLAVTCRRLHDIGRSGWWSLVILLSLIIDLIGEASDYGRDFKMLSAVPMIVLLLFLLRKGADGPNRFGPPPDTGFAP